MRKMTTKDHSFIKEEIRPTALLALKTLITRREKDPGKDKQRDRMPKRKERKSKEQGEDNAYQHADDETASSGKRHKNSAVNVDLMVVLPARSGASGSKSSSSSAAAVQVGTEEFTSELELKLFIRELMDRLASTGFTHMALTHTIYGRPRPNEDRVTTTIPESLWRTTATTTTKQGTKSSPPPIRVLRRLHNIIENLSDVGLYISNNNNTPSGSSKSSSSLLLSPEQHRGPILNEYDILSISPRNESVFQSACQSATLADIITLDYTSGRGGLKLPYKIRSSDVKALIERNAAFEIPFAPALLHDKQRKALVQTCRELQVASRGLKPRVLFSSGDRIFEEKDVGAMALRSPEDLINLMQTVLRFETKLARDAVSATGLAVIDRARQRKFGRSTVSDIYFLTDEADLVTTTTANNASKGPRKLNPVDTSMGGSKKRKDKSMPKKGASDDDDDEEDNKYGEIEDGFISMN